MEFQLYWMLDAMTKKKNKMPTLFGVWDYCRRNQQTTGYNCNIWPHKRYLQVLNPTVKGQGKKETIRTIKQNIKKIN